MKTSIDSSTLQFLKTLLKNNNRNWFTENKNLYIEETNWWGDCYFGVDIKSGLGFNILGCMIIHVRNEIRWNLDPKTNQFIYYFDPSYGTNPNIDEKFITKLII